MAVAIGGVPSLLYVILVIRIIPLLGLQSWFLGFPFLIIVFWPVFLWNGVLWSVSTIGYFYYRLPYLLPRIKTWTNSGNVFLTSALVHFLLKWGLLTGFWGVLCDGEEICWFNYW